MRSRISTSESALVPPDTMECPLCLGEGSLKRTEVESRYVENIRASALDAMKLIAVEKQTAYGKVRSMSSMAQDLQNLERQLWSAMPPAVKSMLDFSTNAGARGS